MRQPKKEGEEEEAGTQTFTSFFHLNFSAPLAMTAVHIAFTYTSLQKPSYFVLIEAAYQLLFPTWHKS